MESDRARERQKAYRSKLAHRMRGTNTWKHHKAEHGGYRILSEEVVHMIMAHNSLVAIEKAKA